MSLAAGALSLVSVASTTASLSSAVATGGTGPYTYQWYRSTTASFTPGSGNIISGATALTLNDSGLIPGTQYYYMVVATDTGNSNATASSGGTGLSVLTTQPLLSQNAQTQSQMLGQVTMRLPTETLSAVIDPAFTGTAYAGQAVKLVANTAGGPPRVTPCTADTDVVFGFIDLNFIKTSYTASQRVEVSIGNYMWLYSTGTVTQGSQVTLDVTTIGGVQNKVSSHSIVGWAMDGCTAAGTLVRIKLTCPAFTTA